MTIRSQPAGALVYVDDYEIGTTPVSTDFTYYGTRKIRLVKDGCETLTVMQSVPFPWYEITPLDLVSENLIPGTLHDQHNFCYQLKPQMVVPSEQLLERAEALRGRGRPGSSLPGAPPMGGALPPAASPGIFPPSNPQLVPPAAPGTYGSPSPQPGSAGSAGGAIRPSAVPPGGWPAQGVQ